MSLLIKLLKRDQTLNKLGQMITHLLVFLNKKMAGGLQRRKLTKLIKLQRGGELTRIRAPRPNNQNRRAGVVGRLGKKPPKIKEIKNRKRRKAAGIWERRRSPGRLRRGKQGMVGVLMGLRENRQPRDGMIWKKKLSKSSQRLLIRGIISHRVKGQGFNIRGQRLPLYLRHPKGSRVVGIAIVATSRG